MEDSFTSSQDEYNLKSDEFELELLNLDVKSTNNKKRPLFLTQEDDEDITKTEGIEVKLTEERSKQYTGQEEYTTADYYKPTGFGQGGLFMHNKRLKLKVQHQAILEDSNERNGQPKPQIFKDLHLYINGMTDLMGLRQLTELLVRHGGTHVVFLDRKTSVTHIIAELLTPKKFEEFQAYKVATPRWLLDSVAAGKLLDWNKYSTFIQHGKASDGTLIGINDTDRLGTQVAQQKLTFGVVPSNAIASGSGMNNQNVVSPFSNNPPLHPVAPITPKKSFLPTSLNISPIKSADDMPPSFFPANPNKSMNNSCFSDPIWLKENTALNPNFLKTYFDQSRLSHLSIWKQELITLVDGLQPPNTQEKLLASSKGKKKVLSGLESDGRTIMHIDFDCFFVSAGLTSREELKGKPVAVCHTEGNMEGSTSEIASCSYEARKKGVKNGMSFGRARELCPEIVSIPFEFDLYKEISTKFYKILLSHSSFLQAVSVDECLIQVELPINSSNSYDPALELAQQIRSEIKSSTGCEASIGISYNILLAKLATRKAKPASAFHLRASKVTGFLKDVEVQALPGIGNALSESLGTKLNVITVDQLRKISEGKLKEVLGNENGTTFFNYARGVDSKELERKKERKNMEVAVNYAIRFNESSQVKKFLFDLSHHLSLRLLAGSHKAVALVLTVKKRAPSAPVITPKFLGHGVCTNHSLSIPIAGPGGKSTTDELVIGNAAWRMWQSLHMAEDQLRGVALSAKLELKSDGGKGVGQGMLGFEKVKKVEVSKKVLEEVKVVDEPAKVKSMQIKKEPSIIIIDSDSDSSPSSPLIILPVPPPVLTSPKKLKVKKPKAPPPVHIPAMFKTSTLTKKVNQFPTASQISDLDLAAMGMDVEVYRSLPEEDQKMVIQHFKTSSIGLRYQSTLKKNGGQTTLSGRITKPNSSTSISKSKSKPVEPIPTITIPPSPPIEITDEAILNLGFLPVEFRSIPTETQLEILRDSKRHRKSLTVTGDRQSENTRIQTRLVNVVTFHPVSFPTFSNKTELEEIRSILDCWEYTKAPGEEVELFVQYLEKLVDGRKVGQGRDLGKVKSLMKWWEYLIEEEWGNEIGGVEGIEEAEEVGVCWWESNKRAKERIHFFVEKEFGPGTKLIE